MIHGPMPLVIVESPFSAPTPELRARNVQYAHAAMLDCMRRGEAPFASHLLYTQYLDDALPGERQLGMRCGFEWGRVASFVAVYVDLGVSGGMREGIEIHKNRGLRVEERTLPGWS